MVGECEKRDLFAVLHSCGNVTKVLDSLARCGFDAIYPLQPGAVDTFEAIEKYRGKFIPYTGIDVQGLMSRSNPAEIKRYIRRVIELAPRGSFWGRRTPSPTTPRSRTSWQRSKRGRRMGGS